MKNLPTIPRILLPAGLLVLLTLALGCSDDPSGPPPKTLLEKLAGDWSMVSVTADTLTHELRDGNAYRYFDSTGASCTLWRTAYGGYSDPQVPGQVDEANLVLTEQHPDFVATWQIVLSPNADTLSLIVIEPDSMDVDSYTLIKVDDAPEATCLE